MNKRCVRARDDGDRERAHAGHHAAHGAEIDDQDDEQRQRDVEAEVGGVDVRIGALVQKVLADAAPRERVAPAPLKQVRLKLRGW